jgi:hypothetical protein
LKGIFRSSRIFCWMLVGRVRSCLKAHIFPAVPVPYV